MKLPPAPDDVLTREDVAAWLKVERRQVARLGIPAHWLGAKTPRYIAREVMEWFKDRPTKS